MWSRIMLRQSVQIGSRNLLNSTKGCISPVLQRCWLSSERNDIQWVKLNTSTKDQPYTFTEEQVKLITKGDPEKELKLKELLLKLYIRVEQGSELPATVKLDSFEVMLTSGRNQLSRLLKYLVKNCKADQKSLTQKEENQARLEQLRKQRLENKTESSWLDYKISHNCLFLQIYQRTVAAEYNTNALKGLQFGQKIIFDCSMESYMWDREIRHTVKQMLFCYDSGRRQRRPFSIHICNLDFNGKLMHYLKAQRPDLFKLPIGLHEDSYLDLFESKNLVYIDQKATKKLVYDPEDIYIIRAIVDRPGSAPKADKKARKEKIRCASLPLDDFVVWKPKAQKHLCLHQYHNILLDVKDCGNWPKAMEAHLPKGRYDSIQPSKLLHYRREANRQR